MPDPALPAAVGIAVSFIPNLPAIELAPRFVLLRILPMPVYAAAVQLPWRDFRENLRSISAMAAGAVLATTTAVAVIAHRVIPSLGALNRHRVADRSGGEYGGGRRPGVPRRAARRDEAKARLRAVHAALAEARAVGPQPAHLQDYYRHQARMILNELEELRESRPPRTRANDDEIHRRAIEAARRCMHHIERVLDFQELQLPGRSD